MPKTFEIPVDDLSGGETYTINPLAVTFLRSQQVRVAEHTGHEFPDDTLCPIQHPENADKPDRLECAWSAPREMTEVCFVNTVGPQSAVTTPLEKRQVKNLLDEALRYNI
jgi:hypothetical protein